MDTNDLILLKNEFQKEGELLYLFVKGKKARVRLFLAYLRDKQIVKKVNKRFIELKANIDSINSYLS